MVRCPASRGACGPAYWASAETLDVAIERQLGSFTNAGGDKDVHPGMAPMPLPVHRAAAWTSDAASMPAWREMARFIRAHVGLEKFDLALRCRLPLHPGPGRGRKPPVGSPPLARSIPEWGAS